MTFKMFFNKTLLQRYAFFSENLHNLSLSKWERKGNEDIDIFFEELNQIMGINHSE